MLTVATQFDPVGIVFLGAIIWGPIVMIRAALAFSRAADTLMLAVQTTAAEMKAKVDRLEYDRYLKDTGVN